MRRFLIPIVWLVIVSCSSTPRAEKDKNTGASQDGDILDESIFYAKDVVQYRSRRVLEVLDGAKKPLVKIHDDLREKLEKCPEVERPILNAHYYSIYDRIGNIIPVTLLITTMESSSFVFLTINKDREIVSCKALTEDDCDLVDQDDEKEEVWCDIRESYLADNEITLVKKHVERTYYGTHVAFRKDSVNLIYRINEDGLLLLTQKDSIRIESPGESRDLATLCRQLSLGEDQSPETMRAIHQQGKDAVALLIAIIDIDKRGHVGFVNQFSSKIDLSENYLGMNAAFMIELIIANALLRDPLVEYEGTALKTPVEGISLGVIARKDSAGSLSRDDMIRLKEIYGQWWNQKKIDSLEDIRSAWRLGDRPLRNSGFVWR